MAAFEAVSKVTFQTFDHQSTRDFRIARLPGVPPTDDGYDPRAHRDPKSVINTWMAYFILLRSVFGPGVLGMPLAISQAGIILGPMMMFFTGLLVIHMHITLLNCLNEVSRQLKIPYISYRYGFRMAVLHGPPVFRCIGERGPVIITVFMMLSQLGICTVFVTFTSDGLRDLMDWPSSRPALFALLIPYLLLEYFMKTLKIVSYVSLAGNVMTLTGLVIVFYHIFADPHGEVVSITTDAVPLFLAYGTMLFTSAAVGVILTLDKALLDPTVLTKRYGVIQVGVFIPMVVSIIFGSLGYWSFGTMEENILRSLPYDDTTSMYATGVYLVAIAFAHPIQCYPAIQIFLETFKNHNPVEPPSEKTLNIMEIIARPSFITMSFILCYLVPFQAPFVAFTGTFCTTILSLICPAMMELSIRYPANYGKFNVYLVKNVLIITLGFVAWILGIFLIGNLIYNRLLSMASPNDN